MSATEGRLPALWPMVPEPRLSLDGDQASYSLRVSKQGAEQFGRYFADFIARSKYATPTDFAREVGFSASAASRWTTGKERPSPRLIERIAPHMGATSAELIAIAYPEHVGAESALPALTVDPIARELGAMLAPDSSLTDDDRHYIRSMTDRLIDPYRRQMRRRRSA